MSDSSRKIAPKPVYNLAVSGANIYEIVRYFQHSHGIQPLKQVLFILDYNQFNAYWENAPDFDENRLSVTFDGFDNPNYFLSDIIPILFSTKALKQSIDTVFRSFFQRPGTYLLNGQRNWHDDIYIAKFKYHKDSYNKNQNNKTKKEHKNAHTQWEMRI